MTGTPESIQAHSGIWNCSTGRNLKSKRVENEFRVKPEVIGFIFVALIASLWTFTRSHFTYNHVALLFFEWNEEKERIFVVFLYSVAGMLATGIGALPFLLFDFRRISARSIGIANSAAAGIMISASFGLLIEGFEVDATPTKYQTTIGLFIGLFMIALFKLLISKAGDFDVGCLHGADANKAILILAIMTLHSFAEGLGIGVAFVGDRGIRLGRAISIAIGAHNIPEGLAISLVILPKGENFVRNLIYCVISSLPQPLIAIPSFLLVQYFRFVLPYGFGIAAGAMLWISISEILPEAMSRLSSDKCASIIIFFMGIMSSFQSWIHSIEHPNV